MSRLLTRLGFTAVVILAGAFPAMAQGTPKSGDLDFAFKLHAGATSGNLKDDMHAQSMLGIGVEGSWALSSKAAIFGELTYSSYGGGEGYDNTHFSGPIYASTGATIGPDGNPLFLQQPSSVDYRKNTLRGFSLRGGYRAIFANSWSWQAGLTIDGMQFRQEASGTLQPKGHAAPPATTISSIGAFEGFAVTPTKTKINLGAFAGLRYQFSEDFFLESNLVSVGYGTANYQPHTYTGQAPSVDSQTRHGILLEVAFGLKL
jgi:hypothetical protein